ncbi:hypothetical protein BEL01nite_60760 [Bradyrhizobium elkanii]|nr:hypothetical protein BEL01nite_60760 [Bradyrhizobium elkanii]
MPPSIFIALREAKQLGGKFVHGWASASRWSAVEFQSSCFEMVWRHGRLQRFAEFDRVAWLGVEEAWVKILRGQAIFLDRLLETCQKWRRSSWSRAWHQSGVFLFVLGFNVDN